MISKGLMPTLKEGVKDLVVFDCGFLKLGLGKLLNRGLRSAKGVTDPEWRLANVREILDKQIP